MNPDAIPAFIGRTVTAPDHLAGARVVAAWLDRDGPEWNWSIELTLDRQHPTEGGYIGVSLDYVNLDIGET